jgi:hypothetical protein
MCLGLGVSNFRWPNGRLFPFSTPPPGQPTQPGHCECHHNAAGTGFVAVIQFWSHKYKNQISEWCLPFVFWSLKHRYRYAGKAPFISYSPRGGGRDLNPGVKEGQMAGATSGFLGGGVCPFQRGVGCLFPTHTKMEKKERINKADV